MKSKVWVRLILAIVVLVFFGHQLYASVYKPITTENAAYCEVVDGINVTGIIMRHETVITGKTDGVYHYLIGDGNRVAKNGVIANIYSNESASHTMTEIEALDAQIRDISELQNYHNQQATDLELINKRVDTALNELVRNCGAGNYESAAESGDRLLNQLNRRQVITGQAADFSERIRELTKRRDALKAELPHAKGEIKASVSGYFSTSADGYENVLTGEDLSAYTVEFLDTMQPQTVGSKVVGKIVSDYDWYVLVKMPINDSLRYKEGQWVELQTEIHSQPSLNAKVARINLSESEESAVVILSCSEMSEELASMRSGPMVIVNKTYKGLKVPKSALRMVDNKRGVYIVSGITLHFVEVKIVYMTDEFALCEQLQTNDPVLRLYDEVVVKGKNLYDGKVVG